MTGDPKVVAALEGVLPLESHLNIQYRHDWRSVKFRGLNKIKGKLHEFGSDAHEWMKKVRDRLLFLGGDDGYQMPAITSQNTITDIFRNELSLEMALVGAYQSLSAIATPVDATTLHKLQHIQMYHERHVAWLERQLDLIGSLGEPAYIQEKL